MKYDKNSYDLDDKVVCFLWNNVYKLVISVKYEVKSTPTLITQMPTLMSVHRDDLY